FTKDFPTEHPDRYERYIRLRSTATRIEAARHPRPATATNPTRDELRDRVASITSPLHVVVGDQDWLFEAAKHLHELVPHSGLTILPGAPHNAYFEAPDAYDAAVTAFLDGLDHEQEA